MGALPGGVPQVSRLLPGVVPPSQQGSVCSDTLPRRAGVPKVCKQSCRTFTHSLLYPDTLKLSLFPRILQSFHSYLRVRQLPIEFSILVTSPSSAPTPRVTSTQPPPISLRTLNSSLRPSVSSLESAVYPAFTPSIYPFGLESVYVSYPSYSALIDFPFSSSLLGLCSLLFPFLPY